MESCREPLSATRRWPALASPRDRRGNQGYKVKVGKFDYANLTRSIVSNETEGFIKIVAEEDSGRILGGHIMGAEASSLIHEVAAAMAGGLTASIIGDTLHAYPTLSEGVRYACQVIS